VNAAEGGGESGDAWRAERGSEGGLGVMENGPSGRHRPPAGGVAT
jgi:hypothetical protein